MEGPAEGTVADEARIRLGASEADAFLTRLERTLDDFTIWRPPC